MTRPPEPFEDDSIDGSLRPLLWRLRARLVTPPVEQRGNADMDRLVAAAREQAHTAPSPGASSRPDVAVDPSAPAFPSHGDELAARRRRGIPHLGRIAAAVVVVVATASGVAGARDGAVTLNALLGRDASPSTQTASEPLPDVGPVEPDDDASDGDGDGDGDGSAAGDLETSEPAPEPAPEANEPAEEPADEDATDAAEDDEKPSDVSDTDTSEQDPSAEEPSSTEPEDETPSTDAPSTDHEVIAAPAPGDADGFGGPAPRDCDSLEDCLPEGETDLPVVDEVAAEDDGESADEGSGEKSSGDDTTSDDTSGESGESDGDDGGDDLANRRFQPSDDEASSS